ELPRSTGVKMLSFSSIKKARDTERRRVLMSIWTANRMKYVTDLDAPLVDLSGKRDYWTPRAGTGGLHWLAGIGMGKSSSAHVIAGAYLRAGFGGLVTIAKPADVELWKRYA